MRPLEHSRGFGAVYQLENAGVRLQFYEDEDNNEGHEYSAALEASNPPEIRRVALSLIEERANAL